MFQRTIWFLSTQATAKHTAFPPGAACSSRLPLSLLPLHQAPRSPSSSFAHLSYSLASRHATLALVLETTHGPIKNASEEWEHHSIQPYVCPKHTHWDGIAQR